MQEEDCSMKGKILITGGSGFIGSNLIAFLLENINCYEIINYDLKPPKNFVSSSQTKFTYIQGNILDKKKLHETFKGIKIEAIIHLAAHTRVIESIEHPHFNFETNVVGTYHILELARMNSIPCVINASTGGAILGEAPMPIHENIVPHPLSPYGASKAAAEAYCYSFDKSYGIRTVSLRFSNVYGIGSFHKGSVIAHFFKQILSNNELIIYGDGNQIRDYIYVQDICRGIYLALITNHAHGSIQLGTGMPTTINQLLKLIEKIVADEIAFKISYQSARRGEIKNTYCDISHAKNILNYQPKVSIVEGLLKTWQWFKGEFARQKLFIS